MPRSGRNAPSRGPKSIAREELVGEMVTVTASGHAPLVGTTGRVVDETANTLVVETEGGREIVVPKRGQRFAIHDQEISGSALEGHPADRIKRNR